MIFPTLSTSVRSTGAYVCVCIEGLVFAIIAGLLVFSATARAEVALPNGEYREEIEDLRVQVLGGPIRVTRDYVFDRWQINARWNPLKFNLDALDGSVKSIDRNSALFERRGDAWVFDARALIRKAPVSVLAPGAGEGSAPASLDGATSSANLAGGLPLATQPGYRWYQRGGQWIDYDQNGRIVAYGDRNDLRVWIEYGSGPDADKIKKVRDHFGRTVLTWIWSGDRLTEIRDNPALISGSNAPPRSIKYQWSGAQLTGVTDVLGHTTTYTWEGKRLKTATDPEGRVRSLGYGPTGRIASVTEADGATTGYLYDYNKTKREFYNRITHPATAAGVRIEERWYDNDGRLIRSDLNGKTQSTLTIDTANRTRSSTDAQGRSTVTTLDEFDNVVKTTYPDGSSSRARYSAAHNGLLEDTDELGIKTTHEYDSKGNRTRTTEALGLPEQRITDYTLNAFGLITAITRKGGAVTLPNGGSASIEDSTVRFEYDAQGNPVKLTDAEGKLTQTKYNLAGLPIEVTDARGKVWKAGYNARGQELSRTNPLDQTATRTWTKAGDPRSETDAGGNTTAWTVDARGRLTQTTNALNHTRRQEYDALGRPTARIDEAGSRLLELAYDLDGRLKESRDGAGNTTAYQYGSDGKSPLPTRIQFPGFARQLAYDPRYRNTEIKDILSEAVSYSTKQDYDLKGNLTRITDRNGKVTTLAWDGLNRLTQVTDPMSGVTRYAYDQRDNLLTVTDANGNTTRYAYDGNNRRTSETRPLGQTQTYTYDDTGNLTQYQDAKGNRLQYTYDAAGRRVEEKHLPANSQTATRTITYSYNPVGSLTGYTDQNSTSGAVAHSARYTLDALQRKTQETITIGGNSHTLTTTWTPTGQKARQTTPGGLTAEYRYDANQQLAGVSLPAGQLSIAERQWNAPKKISFPGGSTQTRDYDALLRPTRIKLNDPGQATKLDYAYTYDAESNITKKATEHGSYDYAYDDLYRLTAVSNPSGLPNEEFTYDKLGNRLTDRRTNGLLATNTWEYNGNNQLLKSFTTNGDPVTHTWDDNGSLTRKQSPGSEPTDNQQFIYDAANRLVEVKDRDGNTVATYQYDPFGRRIAKTTTGNTTFFLYSDEGLIAEATPTGAIATEYGWQPGNLWGTDPLYIKTTKTNGQSPEIFYYQNDHLGTPQKAVDSQGSVVWEARALAFGETTVAQGATIANPLRFPGQYEDPETRMRDNWFRTYDFQGGRYVQSDPIGLAGGINVYGYVKSNPLVGLDPLGLYVYGIYNQATGQLTLHDLETGESVSGSFGSGGRPFGDPIPNGSYDLLQHPDPDYFRLEPADDSYGDDKQSRTGRKELRLHRPGRTTGCIAADDDDSWRKVQKLIQKTKTDNVTVKSKSRRPGAPPNEQLFRYGRITVINSY